MNQRNRVFILIGVIFVIAATCYYFTTDHTKEMVLVGTVDANQVVVSSRIAGRIEKLAVEDGTEVKQGDVIAVLDSAELLAQKQGLEATIASFQSRVSGTRATEQATRGQTSSAVFDAQAKVSAARASIDESQAQLDRDLLDDKRTQALAQSGVMSKQESDRSAQQVKADRARVAALNDQVRAAQAELRSAQAATHQTGAAASEVASTRAQEQNARAQLAEENTRLGYTQVAAPVNGIVSVRAARQGEVVNPGQAIVTLVDYTDTWVQAALPETESGNLAVGDKLRVRLPWGDIIDGQVVYKAPEADFATQRDVNNRKRDIRTIIIKVRVNNAGIKLVPGMTAEVLVPRDKTGARP